MATEVVEWIAFFLFLLLLVAAVVAEIIWLRRRSWTTAGKAAGYVVTTDLVGLAIGCGIAAVAFFIMFMMVMGPAGRGGDSPEWAYWLVFVIASLISGFILFLLKRLGLRIFEIRSGGSAWMYSLVSSVVMVLVVVVPPPLMYFAIATFIQWKK